MSCTVTEYHDIFACSACFKQQIVLINVIHGNYWHPELGSFRFLPSNEHEQRHFPVDLSNTRLLRWRNFIATSKTAIVAMIDILHPPRFGFGMARNESREEEDVAEDVVESVARERGNPTDVDGGEGVVARLEWMDAAQGETWYV